MSTVDELSQRLRAEAMQRFDVRFPNERFNNAVKTLHFLSSTHAPRGNFAEVTVSIRLMQNLCSLAVDGFEAACGYRYEHEKDAMESLLDKIWHNFTWAVMKWVAKQQALGYPDGEPLWYSCFKVPEWFEQAVREDNGYWKESLTD